MAAGPVEGKPMARCAAKLRPPFLALLVAVVGCSVTVGPEPARVPHSAERPLLRLEEVSETLTGSWASLPNVGFRRSLTDALHQAGPASIFTNEPSALSLRIDLVSDHENDEPRLVGLGLLSMATLGMLPLKYYSEWRVQCDVTVRMADGTVVAKYPLQETGTYQMWAFPPTMFSLFFGGMLQGETDGRRMERNTANNLAAKIVEAIHADHPRLAGLQESNARALAQGPGPPGFASQPAARVAQGYARPALKASGGSSPYRPHYRRRLAVVIGINRYQHWPTLEGAAPDARRVAEQFRSMNFDEVLEVYDGEATRTRILQLLGTELAEKTTAEDLAVIFFAGHGQTETLPNGQKRGYIIPVDGGPQDVFATAISMDTLRDLSNRLPAKHVYYAMDSCYSGLGFVRGFVPIPKAEGYLEKMTSRRAVQMITAGAEGEVAIEMGGQGLFTSRFLEALRGEADYDGDGAVTASELGTFVRPSVSSLSRERQTPQFGTLEGTGEVVFAR